MNLTPREIIDELSKQSKNLQRFVEFLRHIYPGILIPDNLSFEELIVVSNQLSMSAHSKYNVKQIGFRFLLSDNKLTIGYQTCIHTDDDKVIGYNEKKDTWNLITHSWKDYRNKNDNYIWFKYIDLSKIKPYWYFLIGDSRFPNAIGMIKILLGITFGDNNTMTDTAGVVLFNEDLIRDRALDYYGKSEDFKIDPSLSIHTIDFLNQLFYINTN